MALQATVAQCTAAQAPMLSFASTSRANNVASSRCVSQWAQSGRRLSPKAAASIEAPLAPETPQPGPAPRLSSDSNQASREGAHEAPLVLQQAQKQDPEQPSLTGALPAFDPATTADVAVVGAGPAGLALAAELAQQGLSVALISPESKFVNNYGVWLDEFRELGLDHTLDTVWGDAVCYFKEKQLVRVGRPYGRVCRRRLRAHLLQKCVEAGVAYLEGEVLEASSSSAEQLAELTLADGRRVRCRLPVLASGQTAGKLLRYESGVPPVAAQTAYGIEATVEGYGDNYPEDAMLFMDFRRHHTGLYDGTANKQQPGKSQHGGDGFWGAEGEVPSFLYAMPLGNGRVFLEETCLVTRPAMPFAVLKRRLERRCRALGIKVKEVHEEEWSYIPVGGPLPLPDQPAAAFGAAASLVHPATGYSITRSLREAPAVARAVSIALREQPNSAEAVRYVWEALWTQEKRRQASFQVFGMELLCRLDGASTADFFTTFFRLPPSFWRGYLASKLSSMDLLRFAMFTWLLAPLNIKAQLIGHFMRDTSGRYMISSYLGKNREQWAAAEQAGSTGGDAPPPQLPTAALGMLMLQQLAQQLTERA